MPDQVVAGGLGCAPLPQTGLIDLLLPDGSSGRRTPVLERIPIYAVDLHDFPPTVGVGMKSEHGRSTTEDHPPVAFGSNGSLIFVIPERNLFLIARRELNFVQAWLSVSIHDSNPNEVRPKSKRNKDARLPSTERHSGLD